MTDRKQKVVKVTLLQPGPVSDNKEKNIEDLLTIVDDVCKRERPDFILFGELSTIPYIGAVLNPDYFDWAEPIPGPVTNIFADKAKKYETCLLLGIFEKAPIDGIFYNSMVVLGPDGKIIEGVFPDGSKVLRFAKSLIPYSVRDLTRYNETYYFTPGSGWPVFTTPKAKVGLTLCYERHFPEPFRILALQGAEIIFNSSVAMAGKAIEAGESMADTYLTELRAHALENSIWLCAVNKAGIEVLQGQETHCYGNSSVIDPTGKIRAQAPSDEAAIITYSLDLEDVVATRHIFRFLSTRRPHLFGLISQEM
jgi:N-carbamoylputrescine amidase